MATHELKIYPEQFRHVKSGRKTFEIRKADRDYKVGDLLDLKEWNWCEDRYSGASILKRIRHIMPGGAWGIKEGYVILGIE